MKYFNESEFKMGGAPVFDKMNSDLLERLDKLRELCDFPLTITSSYRDKDYNASVGGAQRSQHLYGKAVDLKCSTSIKRAVIVEHALSLGLTVGVNKSFIHVDNRNKQKLFLY